MTNKFRWHALYDDSGEGDPYLAYTEGHQDLTTIDAEAENILRDVFYDRPDAIADILLNNTPLAFAHLWLKSEGMLSDEMIFSLCDPSAPGAFAVTGMRFYS